MRQKKEASSPANITAEKNSRRESPKDASKNNNNKKKNNVKGNKFSLADDDYLSAVENGDTDTAERMVLEAAKETGVVKNRRGWPLRLYHGTEHHFGFTEFRGDRLIFTTTSEGMAGGYANLGRSRIISSIPAIEHGKVIYTDENHGNKGFDTAVKAAPVVYKGICGCDGDASSPGISNLLWTASGLYER